MYTSVFKLNQEAVDNKNVKIGINIYLGFKTEPRTSV